MSVREDCGVFGMIGSRSTDVTGLAYYGLYVL